MPAERDAAGGALRVRVMTFNVRYDTPRDAPDHTWDQRMASAIEIVTTYAPDVVGMQEALAHQVTGLTEGLPSYTCFGRARDLGGGGEFVPLLYLHERFEKEQTGVFWLSETPETEGSKGWDADNPRICTWAILRDRATARSFLIVNTHLDRWGTLAREASAELLVARAARFAGLPLIVTGDMNAREEDPPMKVFKAAMLRDSYRDLHHDSPPTIHHYGERLGGKIDYVLCDPNWRVHRAEIAHDRPFDRWPSDHFPVYADLELIA